MRPYLEAGRTIAEACAALRRARRAAGGGRGRGVAGRGGDGDEDSSDDRGLRVMASIDY